MSAEFPTGTNSGAVKRSLRQQAWREIKQLRQETRKAKKQFINSEIFLSDYLNSVEQTKRAISAILNVIYSYWPKH